MFALCCPSSRKHYDPPSEPPPELALGSAPPKWTPAPERSRTLGLNNEATPEEFEDGVAFVRAHPVDKARFLPSADVEIIQEQGCKAWSLLPAPNPPFKGTVEIVQGRKEGGPKVIRVTSETDCKDSCLLSNLPIMAGMYDTHGKEGVYFEVTVEKMDGVIAVGCASKPYPLFRQPGWHRRSAALHLDDMSKFCEDSDGGRPYDSRLSKIKPNDTIGFGHEFSTGSIFFTHNGERLDEAFRGVYAPREDFDVFAAIGVSGPGENIFMVNFGGDDAEHLFRWKPGREWAWLVDGHVGRTSNTVASSSANVGRGDELPSYAQLR